MSKYTTTIDNLMQMSYDFGLRSYPIWNESYRNVLNQKLLNHYRFREIGFETPAMFKFYLNRTMEEIMPYYNELYATKLLEYNPLHNVDYTIEHTKEVNRTEALQEDVTSSGSSTTSMTSSDESTGTTSGSNTDTETNTGTTTANKKNVDIDTPQGNTSITDIDDVTYASKINMDATSGSVSDSKNVTGTATSTTTGSSEGTSSGTGTASNTGSKTNDNEITDTETFTQHLIGNYGVKSSQALIQETRDLIVNIDMMILDHDEIKSLFMQVY